MMESPVDPNGFVFRAAALAYGLTDLQLKRAATETEHLARLAPGIYRRRPTEHVFPEEWHRLVALAICSDGAYAATRAPHASRGVLSFQSAAAVHRMPMLEADFTYVHFTAARGSGNRRHLRHTHPGPVPDWQITEVDGVRVTTIERTAVDVACQGSFAAGLAVFDSALRMGADREEMHEILLSGRRTGIGTARVALEHANPLSDNVGESWSRAQMITARLPTPTLQHGIVVEGQKFYVDFLLPGHVVGEFDGIKKYAKLMRIGEESSDVVVREKRREDLLRSLGFEVVRWVWPDLRANAMVPRVSSKLRERGIEIFPLR